MAIRPVALDIRRADERDIEPLLDLHEAVAAEGGLIGPESPIDREGTARRWREGYLDTRDGCIFVVVHEGTVVGSAHIRQWIGIADVRLVIAEGHRRRGAGSLLLGECIDRARAEGAHKMTLQVWPHNTGAILFYERFGFQREGLLRRHYRRRSGELWDALIMGLVLDPPSTR